MKKPNKTKEKQVRIAESTHWKIGDRLAEIRLKEGRSLTYARYLEELVERDWQNTRSPKNSEGLGSK